MAALSLERLNYGAQPERVAVSDTVQSTQTSSRSSRWTESSFRGAAETKSPQRPLPGIRGVLATAGFRLFSLSLISHHGKEIYWPLCLRIHPLPTLRPADVRSLLSLRRLPATDGQRVRAQCNHRDQGNQAGPRQTGSSAGPTRERTARYLSLPKVSDRRLERLRT